MRFWFWLGVAWLAANVQPVYADSPRVLTDIPPTYALVSALLEGITEPRMLMPTVVDTHHYQLKPSDIQTISQARLVVLTSPGMMPGLSQKIENLRPIDSVIYLSKLEDATLYPYRGETGHTHDIDPHLWLDPALMADLAAKLALQLEAIVDEPETVRANAEKLVERLKSLDAELNKQLRDAKLPKLFVLHDAYQYFEKRYGLQTPMILTHEAEEAMGAATLLGQRKRARDAGLRCILTEQTSRLASSLTEETGVELVMFHPAYGYPREQYKGGLEGYEKLMRDLASMWIYCGE